MQDPRHPKVIEFLALWAEIGIQFAYLELLIDTMLRWLQDKGNGPICPRMKCPLYKSIKEAKRLLKERLGPKGGPGIELCQELDSLRERRNPFIHGKWSLNAEDIAEDRLVYLDYNTNDVLEPATTNFADLWQLKYDVGAISVRLADYLLEMEEGNPFGTGPSRVIQVLDPKA